MYFLPRILELSILSYDWWPDPEMTGRAIKESEPLKWNKTKLEALRNLLLVLMKSFKERPTEGYVLDEWVCAIGRMGIGIKPFLDYISDDGDLLIMFYEVNSESLINSGLNNSFWEYDSSEYETVFNWIKSDVIQDKILQLYDLK